jgi:hypothetical protein
LIKIALTRILRFSGMILSNAGFDLYGHNSKGFTNHFKTIELLNMFTKVFIAKVMQNEKNVVGKTL